MKGGNNIRRKNNSEVYTSNVNTESELVKNFQKINEETSKDNIFLESFSDIIKTTKNQIVDTLHINLEETSMLGEYMKGNKAANKTLIKIISSKFHDLYLKLVNQMKNLKIENSNLKKRILSGQHPVAQGRKF
jgi:hypothetical protein